MAELLLLFIGRRSRYHVEGDSMLPILADGDEVLVNSYSSIDVGDIVIAKNPQDEDITIIKRVAGRYDRDCFSLLGDNPEESIDSRHFGLVEKPLLVGRVVARLERVGGIRTGTSRGAK